MSIEQRRLQARQKQKRLIEESLRKKGLPLIQQKDPVTGEWQAIQADDGIIYGNKLYNSQDQIRGLEEYQPGKFNFDGKNAVGGNRDRREIGYHNGQYFTFPEDENEGLKKIKYLYRVTEGTDYIYYVGGHSKTPIKMFSYPLAGIQPFSFKLSNLSGNQFILDCIYGTKLQSWQQNKLKWEIETSQISPLINNSFNHFSSKGYGYFTAQLEESFIERGASTDNIYQELNYKIFECFNCQINSEQTKNFVYNYTQAGGLYGLVSSEWNHAYTNVKYFLPGFYSTDYIGNGTGFTTGYNLFGNPNLKQGFRTGTKDLTAIYALSPNLENCFYLLTSEFGSDNFDSFVNPGGSIVYTTIDTSYYTQKLVVYNLKNNKRESPVIFQISHEQDPNIEFSEGFSFGVHTYDTFNYNPQDYTELFKDIQYYNGILYWLDTINNPPDAPILETKKHYLDNAGIIHSYYNPYNLNSFITQPTARKNIFYIESYDKEFNLISSSRKSVDCFPPHTLINCFIFDITASYHP